MGSDFSIQTIQQTLANTAETVKSKLQDRDVQKMIAKGLLATIGAVAFVVITAGFGVPAAAVVFGAVIVFGGDFALLSMLEKDKKLEDKPLSIPLQELTPVAPAPLPAQEAKAPVVKELPAIAQSSMDRLSEAEETELMAAHFAKTTPVIEPAPIKKNLYFERIKEPSTLSNDLVDSNMALYVEEVSSNADDQQSSLSSKLLKGAAVASFVALGSYALSSIPAVVATAIDTLPYLPIL